MHNENKDDFDEIISSETPFSDPIIKNIAELLFTTLPHRDEQSNVILSHVEDTYVEVSLQRLRYIIVSLYQEFEKKNIQPGETVLLVNLSVDTALYTILLLTGLITYGVRVLFPMFVETTELDRWIKQTNCSAVIFPQNEIQKLLGYERQKQVIKDIKTIAFHHHLPTYDISEDFHLAIYLNTPIPSYTFITNTLIQKSINTTDLSTESIIFTTSGTSGRSKLVVYDQGGFLRNCQCWQASGLYQKDKLGGRCFLDILPHTISIRSLFNGFWTGYPVCIVKTEWIKQKPQKLLPLLVKMRPQVMTLGPNSFQFLVELSTLAPEIKKLAFSELTTVVSTGAPYSKTIAEDMKKQFHLRLHNAYGLTETQQVLTTVIDDVFAQNSDEMNMGKPIAGVILGLKKYDGDMYSLFVKTPFGHKAILDETKVPAEEFFNTGDIIKYRKPYSLTYVGREKKDFIKSGYGAKIPISSLKEYYKPLYQDVNHIEYMPFETFDFSLGIAALIFISDPHLPAGRIIEKNIIKKFSHRIITINKRLIKNLEPFEYEQRIISRFLLINHRIDTTYKGTVSGYSINMRYATEKHDLMHSNNPATGVKTLGHLNSVFIKFLLKNTPLRLKKIRKLLLRLILR